MAKEQSGKDMEGKKMYREWTPDLKFAIIMEYFTERK